MKIAAEIENGIARDVNLKAPEESNETEAETEDAAEAVLKPSAVDTQFKEITVGSLRDYLVRVILGTIDVAKSNGRTQVNTEDVVQAILNVAETDPKNHFYSLEPLHLESQ